jgi:hypothetical protein
LNSGEAVKEEATSIPDGSKANGTGSRQKSSKKSNTKGKTTSRPRKKRKVEVEEDEEMLESENDESMEENQEDKGSVPDRPLNVRLRARKGKAASNIVEDSGSG